MDRGAIFAVALTLGTIALIVALRINRALERTSQDVRSQFSNRDETRFHDATNTGEGQQDHA